MYKQNQFAKGFECSEVKVPFLDLGVIFMKMERVLNKFTELIWLSWVN